MTIIKKLQEIFRKRTRDELSQQETEFLPAVLEVTETPPSPVGRGVMWTIMVLLVLGLLWSIFGKVDEVAVANGKLIPVGQVKTIQAESKGIVKAIHVKEGQLVKKGDVLIELDQTVTAADLARLQKEAGHYELEVERLLAEQTGRSFDARSVKNAEPKEVDFQQQYYLTRMTEYRYRLNMAQSALSQARAALVSAQANQEKYRQQLEIAKEREERLEQLIKQNAVSYFVYLEYRSKRMELEQGLSAQVAEVARQEAAVAQAESQLSGTEAQWASDVAGKLVEARKQLNAYSEEWKKAQDKNRYTVIMSPVDGRVNQLAIHTLGGIVTEAQALMNIVPDDATIEVEAWAANKDIGFIQLGQEAAIKVETFNFQKYGTFKAKVTEISPDAVEDPKDKQQKYRIMLELEKDNLWVDGRTAGLTAGMTATAEIKIKEKRIIEYFLDPFRQYTNEALRER